MFDRFLAELDWTVRDSSILQAPMVAPPRVNSGRERWERVLLVPGDAAGTVANAVPDVVDTVMFYVLVGIDNEDWALSWERESGERVDLAQHGRGEMAGWYVGPNGWRVEFSRESADEVFAGDIETNPVCEDAAGRDFGRTLIEQVRDPAVRAGSAVVLDPTSSVGRLMSGDPAEAFQAAVPQLVDLAVNEFLRAVDEGRLRIWWHPHPAEVVDLRDGDLVRRFAERRRNGLGDGDVIGGD